MARSTTTTSDRNFYELEAQLAGTLRPVAPPRGLIQRLRERIRIPEPRVLAERLVSWRFFFAIVGGVMSGALVIITLARALFHIARRK